MKTPMVSVRLRAIGSCCTPRHWVHVPCGEFQRKGVLVGARGVDKFWGIPGVVDARRLTIKRDGIEPRRPPGVGRHQEHGCDTDAPASASLSKRLRSSLLASELEAPSRAANRSNFAVSVNVCLHRIIKRIDIRHEVEVWRRHRRCESVSLCKSAVRYGRPRNSRRLLRPSIALP